MARSLELVIAQVVPNWQLRNGRRLLYDGKGLPETFLTRAHRLATASHTNAALDLIYDAVDELMQWEA